MFFIRPPRCIVINLPKVYVVYSVQVRSTYSNLPWDALQDKVREILQAFPNTGFKRMQGYLMSQGLKVLVMHIRRVMWEVDPNGVYGRLSQSRVIIRRKYFVPFSNSMWHIDTHLKLKRSDIILDCSNILNKTVAIVNQDLDYRWGIVIRGGIDGKSRTCVYLEAGTNNSANSNLESFLKGVDKYGIPYRCRSDKGGENVLVAQYMLENRGTGRSSHICGRSVHNQRLVYECLKCPRSWEIFYIFYIYYRIERFWVDVQSACLAVYKQLFIQLEVEEALSIENCKQMAIFHRVFLPRINCALKDFMDGWNSHPISSENYYSPQQLMLMHQPPPDYSSNFINVRKDK